MSITDDDLPPTGIVLALDDARILEDGGPQQRQLTATLQGNMRSLGTLVSLELVEGTAVASDFVAMQSSVTIPSGQQAGTAPVVLIPRDDLKDEGDETAQLGGSTSLADLLVSATQITIVDNDDRGIVLSETSLTVDEGDATGASYTVKLSSEPSEEVTITVSGQAGTDLTLAGLSDDATLTFTTSNWNTAQSVTVTAGQDTDDGDDSVTLTHTAAGGDYAGETATLAVTVDDDDRGIVLSETSLTVEEGDATGVSYTVKLSSEPSEDVTVTVSGQAGTDLTLAGLSDDATLTFTTSNWNTAQSVTVTAGQDADGADDSVTLTHTAAGAEYDGTTATLAVTVTDDDRGIILTPDSLTVDEGDTTGVSYTVKLAAEPSGEVKVTVSGQSGSDLTLTGLSTTGTLTFTTTNWNTAQTVTVTADEDTDDTDDTVTLTHTAAGGDYDGATATLAVTVADDDRGIILHTGFSHRGRGRHHRRFLHGQAQDPTRR